MAANIGLRLAYLARNTAGEAIRNFRPANCSMTPAEASALARLIDAFDTASERIRILRGRPLPGTARIKRPAAKDTRTAVERPPAEPITIPEKHTHQGDDASVNDEPAADS